MAWVRRSVVVDAPPDEVFAYMAAFENVAEWDPGVVEAGRLDEGSLDVGARFRVVAAFLGSRTELVYEIEKLEPPRRVVLRAENERFRSEDTIECSAVPGGPENGSTLLTYDARLVPKGALAMTDPVLQLAFRWIGNRAFWGLERKLAERWGRRAKR